MKQGRRRMALLVVIALLVTLAVPMSAMAAEDSITAQISPEEATYIVGAEAVSFSATFTGDDVANDQKIVWYYAAEKGVPQENGSNTVTGSSGSFVGYCDSTGISEPGVYKVWAELKDESEESMLARTEDAVLTVLPATTPEAKVQWDTPSVNVGQTARATVSVTNISGEYSKAFQWQINQGNGWRNITSEEAVKYNGYNLSALSIADVSYTENGDLFRCVVTVKDKEGETAGEATSEELELSVVEPGKTPEVKITAEPKAEGNAVTIKVGQSVVMTAEASTKMPENSFAYQWTKDGKPLTGETSETLTINPTEAAEAAVYNCEVTNTFDGVEYKASAAQGITLTVEKTTGAVEITAQPESKTVNAAANVEFKVAAKTDDNAQLAYQWQRSFGGTHGVFTDINGATSDTLRVEDVTYSMSGYQYRCVISNADNAKVAKVESEAATLTVKPLGHEIVWTGAEDADWASGKNAEFTAKSGEPFVLKLDVATEAGDALTYQWQVMSEGQYRVIAGATTNSYTIANAGPADETLQYKCIVTNPYDKKTAEYTADVKVLDSDKIPTITSQPQALMELKKGTQDVMVTVKAEAPQAGQELTYKWEYRGRSAGQDWTAWTLSPGVTDNAYPANTGEISTYQYRCTVGVEGYDEGAVTSDAATVIVYEENIPYIVSDLEAEVTGYVGETLTFSVDAKVNPDAELLYIWTKDGEVVKEALGAEGASYTTSMLGFDDIGSKYACEVRNPALYDAVYHKEYAVKSNTCTIKDVKASTLAPAVPGDLNGNGKVDIDDVVAAVDAMNDVIVLDADKLALVDFNDNGKVDIDDVVELVALMNA